MAAAEIQVVNPENLQKIESFFNDSAYREAIENSASFNTRLCVERRLRMPFLDPQTGVAQNHCSLFMSRRQRMPGAREGQIYTYPAARWRKARRQYLSLHSRGRWGAFGAIGDGISGDGFGGEGDGSMDAHDTDSKDSHHARDGMMMKDEVPKEWLYDDIGMEELDPYDEPEPDSDEDYYDDSYSGRRRRGGGAGGRGGERGSSSSQSGNTGSSKGKRRGGGQGMADGVNKDGEQGVTPKGRGRGGGRGRKKAIQQMLPYEVAGDADKPYGCELCGARYKTRPGLTYHYTHSHKDPNSGGGASASAGSDGDSRDSAARPPKDLTGVAATTPSSLTVADPAGTPVLPSTTGAPPSDAVMTAAGLASEYQDSYVTFLNNPAGPSVASASAAARRSRPSAPAIVVPPSAPAPPDPSSGPVTATDTAVVTETASSAAPEDDEGPVGNVTSPLPPSEQAPPLVEDASAEEASTSTAAVPVSSDKRADAKHAPSPYCDFCLGDHRQNKKTGIAEELVSCSDCGRSGETLKSKDGGDGNNSLKVKESKTPVYECSNKGATKHTNTARGRKKSQALSSSGKIRNVSVRLLSDLNEVNGENFLGQDDKIVQSDGQPTDDSDRFVGSSESPEETPSGRDKSDISEVESSPEAVESPVAVRKSTRKNSANSAIQIKRKRRK